MARTGVFGRSGVGKSWMFGKYLEDVIPEFEFAVHFDIEDEEVGLSEKGYSLLKSFYVDQEFAAQTVEYDGREIPLTLAVILENKKVRVIPDGLTDTEQKELFAEICGLAMEVGKQGSNMHLSADEAHMLIDDGDLDDRVRRVLTGGRKKGIEWAFCTQQPASIHPTAFTQMNFGIYFHLPKDNDRMKVNNSTGFDAFHKLADMIEREAYIENSDTGELRHVNTNDMERKCPHYGGDDGKADQALAEMGETVDRSGE